MVEISYDPAKRLATIHKRGVDFDEAIEVFSGPTFDEIDDRFDYGELRIRTMGFWKARMVAVVWTPRDGRRHIISMRKANAREQARYKERLEEVR